MEKDLNIKGTVQTINLFCEKKNATIVLPKTKNELLRNIIRQEYGYPINSNDGYEKYSIVSECINRKDPRYLKKFVDLEKHPLLSVDLYLYGRDCVAIVASFRQDNIDVNYLNKFIENASKRYVFDAEIDSLSKSVSLEIMKHLFSHITCSFFVCKKKIEYMLLSPSYMCRGFEFVPCNAISFSNVLNDKIWSPFYYLDYETSSLERSIIPENLIRVDSVKDLGNHCASSHIDKHLIVVKPNCVFDLHEQEEDKTLFLNTLESFIESLLFQVLMYSELRAMDKANFVHGEINEKQFITAKKHIRYSEERLYNICRSENNIQYDNIIQFWEYYTGTKYFLDKAIKIYNREEEWHRRLTSKRIERIMTLLSIFTVFSSVDSFYSLSQEVIESSLPKWFSSDLIKAVLLAICLIIICMARSKIFNIGGIRTALKKNRNSDEFELKH